MANYREQIRYHVTQKGVQGRPLRKEDFQVDNEDQMLCDIKFLEEAVRILHIDIGRAHARIRRLQKILIWVGIAVISSMGILLRELFLMLFRQVMMK